MVGFLSRHPIEDKIKDKDQFIEVLGQKIEEFAGSDNDVESQSPDNRKDVIASAHNTGPMLLDIYRSHLKARTV